MGERVTSPRLQKRKVILRAYQNYFNIKRRLAVNERNAITNGRHCFQIQIDAWA